MMRVVRGSLSHRLFAAALLLLCSAGSTWAQGHGVGACRADVEKLCKDVKRGEGGIAQCLKQNEASVSPACKEAMAQMREKMQALIDACKDDAKQYCEGVQHGHGRIMKCLIENDAKLSEGCHAAIQGARGGGDHK